jgi:hypothetical protein
MIEPVVIVIVIVIVIVVWGNVVKPQACPSRA